MPRSTTPRRSLELPAPLYERLAAEADRQGRTTTSLAVELLSRALPQEHIAEEMTVSRQSIQHRALHPRPRYVVETFLSRTLGNTQRYWQVMDRWTGGALDMFTEEQAALDWIDTHTGS